MATVYRLSTVGGKASPRFKAYIELGAQRVLVSGYNPMATTAVLATIEGLLAVEAEPVAEALANRTVASLGTAADRAMHLCVKTPGMWTDRVASEVEHRMVRGPVDEIVLWTGEPVDLTSLQTAVVAQSTRLAWSDRRGHPVTVADFVAREGLAEAMAGVPGRRVAAVADLLAVVADETSPGVATALLYGDDTARALGWSPLGIAAMDGYAHATALANEALQWSTADKVLERM